MAPLKEGREGRGSKEAKHETPTPHSDGPRSTHPSGSAVEALPAGRPARQPGRKRDESVATSYGEVEAADG